MANPLKLLKLKPTSFQFIQEVKIDAPPKRVWSTLAKVQSWFTFDPSADNRGRKLELWPGGRFMVEHPDGTAMLHAFVTYMEPGKLLRLSGQMGLTHLPVNNVFIFELQERGKEATLLRFCQRTFGFIDADVQKRMKPGWGKLLASLKSAAENKKR